MLFFFFMIHLTRDLEFFLILSKKHPQFPCHLVQQEGISSILLSCMSFMNSFSYPYRWLCPWLWVVSSHVCADLNSPEDFKGHRLQISLLFFCATHLSLALCLDNCILLVSLDSQLHLFTSGNPPSSPCVLSPGSHLEALPRQEARHL